MNPDFCLSWMCLALRGSYRTHKTDRKERIHQYEPSVGTWTVHVCTEETSPMWSGACHLLCEMISHTPSHIFRDITRHPLVLPSAHLLLPLLFRRKHAVGKLRCVNLIYCKFHTNPVTTEEVVSHTVIQADSSVSVNNVCFHSDRWKVQGSVTLHLRAF